jgi:hypothetical protein
MAVLLWHRALWVWRREGLRVPSAAAARAALVHTALAVMIALVVVGIVIGAVIFWAVWVRR